MKKNKPVLAILTESIRRDNHVPLSYFSKIRVYHFYKRSPYGEMTGDELQNAIHYKSLGELKQKIIALHPDVIQGAEPYGSKEMFLLSHLAYSLSRKMKIPLIFSCWENRPIKKKLTWLKRTIALWFMKKYVRQASLIFYLNEGARKNLLQAGAEQARMIKFLWGTWGVDTGLFKPEIRNSKSEIRNPTILFGGRLDEAKGIKYLLPAFLKVKEKVKNARLILIGSGELESWAKEFVRKHKLEEDVSFTGVIKTRDLPKYLNIAAVFTCPSVTLSWWEEQVGMINLQAMSAGVPVVSTYSGAIPEYVQNGRTGILVREKTVTELADALVGILRDEKMRAGLAKDARIYALEHFDAQQNVVRAEKMVLDLLSRNTRTAA